MSEQVIDHAAQPDNFQHTCAGTGAAGDHMLPNTDTPSRESNPMCVRPYRPALLEFNGTFFAGF
jgi:hypothetical protein